MNGHSDERESTRLHPLVSDEGASACDVVLEAGHLMKGGREAIIIHNGERYRLRITSKQRLILTK